MSSGDHLASGVPLDRAGRHTWALFVDWCTATELIPLPAEPGTVAAFLDDHPAESTTHRRRVGAINAVHRWHDLPKPGAAPAVQRALATHRHQRLLLIVHMVEAKLASIPTHGWPAGLFGRRDALILTLVAGGLAYRDIASLHRGDIRYDGGSLVVTTDEQRTITPTSPDARYSPAAVHAQWAQIQTQLDRFPSVRRLAEFLSGGSTAIRTEAKTTVLPERAASEPLIVRIDRWGATPLPPTPLSAESISVIARAHLAGHAPIHSAWTGSDREVEARAPQVARPAEYIALDPRSHVDGIRARQRAHADLTQAGALLDEVSARAEGLLLRLAGIVGDMEPDGAAD